VLRRRTQQIKWNRSAGGDGGGRNRGGGSDDSMTQRQSVAKGYMQHFSLAAPASLIWDRQPHAGGPANELAARFP
jgi:hypothetical protein